MKEKILHKATDMFLNFGFKSITMDDIATELGISKKTIYAHYSTKTKLVEASAMHIFYQISSGIETIKERKLNVIEEIFVIKDFVRENLKDEKSSPVFQLQKYYPKIYANMSHKQLEIMNTCVVDNLIRGIENGIYRKNIKPNFIARFYYSGMTSIKNIDLFPVSEFPMPVLVKEFIEYHLRAIVTEQGLQTLKKFIDEKNH